MAASNLSLEFEDWPPVPELHIKAAPQACDVFLENITSQVNSNDVQQMVAAQVHMLSRFEKTNEMLANFNHLANSRFSGTYEDFMRHTQLLTDMKQDLDNIFKRIRVLKSKLAKQHPQAFAACHQRHQVADEEGAGGSASHQTTHDDEAHSFQGTSEESRDKKTDANDPPPSNIV